jgi:hypothetical protein
MYNYTTDIKGVGLLQSVKVTGQSLIAAIDVTPSGDDDALRQ